MQERGELPVHTCVGGGAQELRCEEEEGLRSFVVAGTIDVGTVLQHPQHPFEGAGKLVSAPT
jgi:hypothetical protein